MPGDTRMVTTFKLVDRAVTLRPVLEALVTDPDYDRAAQCALASYNCQAPEAKRIACIDGVFVDKVKASVLCAGLWQDAQHYLQAF